MSPALLPDICLALLAFGVLFMEIFVGENIRRQAICIAASLGLFAIAVLQMLVTDDAYIGAYEIRSWTAPFKIAVLFSAIFSIGMVPSYFDSGAARKRVIGSPGVVIFLMLIAVLGTFVVSSSTELITLFIGLELSTIPMYVIAASFHDKESSEASIKYLITGSLATAFMVFGCSYIYGSGGSLLFEDLCGFLDPSDPFAVIGGLCMTMALLFKLSAAPFHMWAPDIYEGAPTPAVAYIASGSKASALVALLIILDQPLHDLVSLLLPVFVTVAIMSMLIGNLGALRQPNFNRFMAYSSIAQVGFFLLALLGEEFGTAAIAFYVLVYCVSNYLGFYVFNVITANRPATSGALRGLSLQSPLLALCLMLAMFSLAGIPPLAGFVGKFALFMAATKSGLYWLVLVAALNALVSLYYYLRVIKAAYIDEVEAGETPQPIRVIAVQRWALAALAILVIALGVWSRPNSWVFDVCDVELPAAAGTDAVADEDRSAVERDGSSRSADETSAGMARTATK